MLAAKRLLAHGVLFAALLGVVLAITAFSAGIAGYLASAGTAGVREGFGAATGSDGAVRAELRDAGAGQDAAVRALVADTFAPAPMLVDRTLQSDPLELDGGETALVLASLPIQERGVLVDGDWASTTGEAVLQADAAELLGVRPGDTLSVRGLEFEVTGTWRAADPLSPVWFGEALAASGVSGDAVGPLIVAEDAYGDVVPFARWVIRPDPAAIEPGQLDAVATGASGIADVLAGDDAVGTGNVIFGGGLAQLTSTISGSLDALGGVAPVPALLVGAIGLVTVIELARLLVNVRRIETGLLRSRGASALRLTGAAALEAGGVAVPAALLGALAAWLLTGSPAWPVAAGVVAGTVAAFALVTFLDARRPPSRETAQDSGRGRAVAGLGLVVLAVVAAVVSVWQFRLYGSPVIRAADGSTNVDPIAVLAPTAALLAAALLVVVLFEPVSAALQSAAVRRAPLRWVLAARQVARRTAVFTTPVLLLALAVGGLVIAGTYSATWDRATATSREVTNGADVRLLGTGVVPEADGVDAATPAYTSTLQVGDDLVALVALPAGAMPDVVNPAGGAIDAAALADGIRVEPALPLPDGAISLEVEATAPTGLWLVDDTGRTVLLDAPYEMPAGRWSLAGAEVEVDAEGADYAYRLSSVSVDGAALELGEWVVADGVYPFESVEPPVSTPDAIGFDAEPLRPNPGTVRLVPVASTTLPVVISQSFADRGALALGDELTLRFAGSGRELVGTVTGVAPVLPGTSDGFAVLADLARFATQQLALSTSVPVADEVWIRTADPQALAGALAAPGIRVTTIASGPGDALLSAGRVALWIGAVGGLLLAVAAVGAITGAMLRARSGEVVVLRVIGLGGREQSSSRRREFAVVLGFAVLGGLVAGAVVSALTVPELARSAVLDPPRSLPTALLVDPVATPALLAVTIALLAGVVVAYGVAVARQARTLSVREEVR